MRRELKGNWAWAIKVVAIVFALFQLVTAAFGYLPDMQQRGIHVAFGFILTFSLISPTKRSEGKVPIWDLVLIGLLLVCIVNLWFSYLRYTIYVGESTTLDLVLGGIIIILTLEVGRRTTGLVFPILTMLFIIYALFGAFIPGSFGHRGFSVEYLIQNLNQSTIGVWGGLTGISATIISIFIIFGAILLFTGGGETFTNVAIKIAGRMRGGPAQVAVIASALFGTISGSAGANVATTGNFTIPLMKRLGYKPEFAAGVEATASSGGQLAPPIMGIGAFIMAEMLGIPYLKVCIAAAFPALLFFLAVFSGVRFEALRLKLAPMPEEMIPPASAILTWSKLSPLIIPIALLVGLLIKGHSVTMSGLVACLSALVLYLFSDLSLSHMRQRLVDIAKALETGGKNLIQIVPIVVCANIVICLINMTGVGVKFASLIMGAAGVSIILGLALGAIIALILGMGMPTVAAYIIAASVVSPALINLGGAEPLTMHLFIFYFAILSGITPPVCGVVFIAAGMARSAWFKTAVVSMKLALAAYIIPFIFVIAPAIIMKGSTWGIAIAVFSAIIGVLFLAASMFGYLSTRLHVAMRVLFFLIAVLNFIPFWQANLTGIILGTLTLSGQVLLPRVSMVGRIKAKIGSKNKAKKK